MNSLYEALGESTIRRVITLFYQRAFTDPILAHFFMGKDIAHLTNMQTQFAIAMLGGPNTYRGRPLKSVHHSLPIRKPHFGRRQVLMAEVLKECGVAEPEASAWLAMEDQLKPLILPSAAQVPPGCTSKQDHA